MTDTALAEAAKSDELLGRVAEHWMNARIDAPLATTDRIDQSAKQMIALAAGLQALLAAVVKIAKVDHRMLEFAVVAFAFLFLSIIFSAGTILLQTDYMRTSSILELLEGPRDIRMLTALGNQIHQMCRQVDRVLRHKRILLAAAMIAFCCSLAASLACLSSML
ncbi:MAG TPA: hypothetical protein VFJ82_11520 [Longimicrobium sp.]|nr:hypothetical protein [Longimicrobium sp.]